MPRPCNNAVLNSAYAKKQDTPFGMSCLLYAYCSAYFFV